MNDDNDGANTFSTTNNDGNNMMVSVIVMIILESMSESDNGSKINEVV